MFEYVVDDISPDADLGPKDLDRILLGLQLFHLASARWRDWPPTCVWRNGMVGVTMKKK